MKKHMLCACMAGFCTLATAQSVFAETLPDRLDRPARHTSLAPHKLVNDLQVVGDQVISVGADGAVLRIQSETDTRQGEVPVDLLLTAVDFVTSELGWAVGHDGAVLVTRDGGASWEKQIDGTDIGALMQASAEQAVSRLEQAVDENPDDQDLALQLEDAIFKLEDIQAGREYGPSLPLMDVEFTSETTGFAVGAYGMAVETRDGGESWQYISGIRNPYSFHLNAVFSSAPDLVFVAGENGLVFRSADNGRTWDAPQEVGNTSIYSFVAGNNGEILALGFGGALFVSQDQGISWNSLNTGTTDTLFGGSALSNGGVLLAQRGGLLYSENLKDFQYWPAPGRSIWMDVVEPTPGQLLLGGQAGIKSLPLDTVLGGLE